MANTPREVLRVDGVLWCSCVGGPSPPTPIVLVCPTGAANAFRLSACGGGRDGSGVLSGVDGYFLALLNFTQTFLSSHLPPRIAPCFFQFPVLQAKHSTSHSLQLFKTRSLVARHFEELPFQSQMWCSLLQCLVLLVGGRLSARAVLGALTFGRVQSSICQADYSKSRQGPS